MFVLSTHFVAFDRKDSYSALLTEERKVYRKGYRKMGKSMLMFRMEGPMDRDGQPGRTRRWKTFSVGDGQTAAHSQWAEKLLSAMAQACHLS